MLATILLADFANIANNGKINATGVFFRQIEAYQFPFRHSSMYLVINLQTMPLDEVRGEMDLIARLIDADGTVLHQLEMPFTFPEWSGNLRPEANFIFQINNLQFSYPGEYVWDVFVNEENVGRYEFNLNQQAKENG